MNRKRFSVEQIVGILKQAEVGVPVADRQHPVVREGGLLPLTAQIKTGTEGTGMFSADPVVPSPRARSQARPT